GRRPSRPSRRRSARYADARTGAEPADTVVPRHGVNVGKTMPKNKTHSGAKKRFKVTGSGKLMREQANGRHYLEGKSSRRTRRLAMDKSVSAADVPAIKKMLGK